MIPNAEVILTNESSGIVVSAKTNEAGQLRLASLPQGRYKISVVAPGFKTFNADSFTLPDKTPLQLKLEPTSMMGVVINDGPFLIPATPAPVSDLISEPANTAFVGEVVAVDHRNPIRKFFSRLRHIL